jgi:hypothetical protein
MLKLIDSISFNIDVGNIYEMVHTKARKHIKFDKQYFYTTKMAKKTLKNNANSVVVDQINVGQARKNTY